MNVDNLDRFTLWQYRLVRRVFPRTPRRYSMPELDLRAKELNIMLFALILAYGATMLNVLLN